MDIDNMNFFNNQLKPVLEEGHVTDLLTDEDRHLIKLWKKLQQLAINPRTKFDFGQHKGSNNLGIINFCKFCDIDPESFIREYLLGLSPFMIHPINSRDDKLMNFSCIIDASYSLPLWVEVITTQFNEEVISFHEMNWRNEKYISYMKDNDRLLCSCSKQYPTTALLGERDTFFVTVIRGFKAFNIRVIGERVSADFIKVNKATLFRNILEEMNTNLEDILREHISSIEGYPTFNKIEQIPFTSYGSNLGHQLSLLLDVYLLNKKSAELTAAISHSVQLLLNVSNHEIIIEYLIDKFKSYHGIDISGLLVTGDMGMPRLGDGSDV